MADTADDIAKQVRTNVDRVRSARDWALAQKELGMMAWLPQNKNAAAGIRGLSPAIEAWAKTGQDAAAARKAPGTKGWAGWIAAGQEFVKGLPDIADAGSKYALQDIVSTAREAPATSAKAVKATAKKTAEVATKAAAAVGETVTSVGSTLKWVGVGAAVLLVAVIGFRVTR